MRAIRLPNGNLLVPVEPADPGGAPDLVEIGPGHPGYARWLAVAEDGDDPRPPADGWRPPPKG